LKILLVAFQPLIDTKKLNVYCPPFDDVILTLSRDSLETVLTNLLSNAIKYTPAQGDISILVDANDLQVTIAVSDTGIGISEQDQGIVFNRFTRADTGNEENIPGAGIGLALVKELVEGQNGRIELSSVINQGSCFTVTLPIDKLDGAADSLVYNKGLLIRATRRGNRKEGIDITKNVRLLKTVPWEIDTKSLCQIDGEVVAPSSIRNARNYASGALNLKDVEEFKERRPYLSFVVHDIRPDACCGHYINPPKFWSSKMDFCDSLGFHTDLTFDATDYPTDGKVFRLDNLQEWEEEGFTSHHPRGSIALKEQKEGVVTKLLDVVWQTGKSGVVTPVAELEPVMIGDAQVSRATLHNMQYIEELGLEIGCSVEVIRSGEIIPRIVRRVN
jgi:DNA ligase (NAD+)